MTISISFEELALAAEQGGEPARAGFADGNLVAILVPIADESIPREREGWFLEIGFGRCRAECLFFQTLADVESWIQARISNTGELSRT